MDCLWFRCDRMAAVHAEIKLRTAAPVENEILGVEGKHQKNEQHNCQCNISQVGGLNVSLDSISSRWYQHSA